MAHIDFVLDTSPMAHEVSTVSGHVKGTTTAVVAMKTAVLIAEDKAARNVCDKVNRGFFTMIQSSISQKMAKLQSEVDSWLLKLQQLRHQAESVRERMGRDYHMLSQRYLKIFNAINHNLHQRIVAIDRPVIDIMEKDLVRVNNRPYALTSAVPLMQREALTSSQTILTGEVKNRGTMAIEAISDFITQSCEQDRLISRVLLPRSIDSESRLIYVPVVISQSNFDASGTLIVNVLADREIPQSGVDKIRSSQDSLAWRPAQAPDGDVAFSFNEMLRGSNLPERVKRLAAEMMQKAQFEKL